MSAPGGASCLSFGRRAPPAAAAPASDRDPPRPSPSLAASSASSCADAAPKPRTAGLEADGDKRTDGNDDDAELREILALAGIKLDDEPRDLFAPDVLRRVGEDAAAAVDPRVAAAVDALHSRCFPEGEDGRRPRGGDRGGATTSSRRTTRRRPSIPRTARRTARRTEERARNTRALRGRRPGGRLAQARRRRVARPGRPQRRPPSRTLRLSPRLPRLHLLPSPRLRLRPRGNRTRDLDRMLGACKVVLAWYAGVLEENTAVCRRRRWARTSYAGDPSETPTTPTTRTETHMANLASAWKPGDPQPFSPGLPTSLYVQDQCSYHYDVFEPRITSSTVRLF